MNIERLTILAETLEGIEAPEAQPDWGFNMGWVRFDKDQYEFLTAEDYSGHSCNTVACIAGWAGKLFGEGRGYQGMDEAQTLLGIDWPTRRALFEGAGAPPTADVWHARPSQAARVIRGLIRTGEVDWSVVAEEGQHHD